MVNNKEEKSKQNLVYIYNINEGLKYFEKDLKVRTDVFPLIADVNGDNIAEIIIQSEGKEGFSKLNISKGVILNLINGTIK